MKNNAFHILGVNPSSTRKEITNAREDALFDGNFPEEVIKKAESALIKPIPRLYEELTFLWGSTPDLRDTIMRDGDGKGLGKAMFAFRSHSCLVSYAKNESGRRSQILMINLSKLPDIAKANITAEYCLQHKGEIPQRYGLDAIRVLADAQKGIDKDVIGDLINAARKESKVVPPIDEEHIADGLKKLRNEKFKKAIIYIITKLLTKSHDMLANVAELAEHYQYDKSPAGRFFREFICSDYKNWIQPQIEPIEAKIKKAVEKLKESPDDSIALKTIETELLQWDDYYQPIQLMEEARDYDEKKSGGFLKELRDLSFHLHKKGASETALRVSQLLALVFRELPQASQVLKEDIDSLKEIIANEKRYSLELQDIAELCRITEKKILLNPEYFHQDFSDSIFRKIVRIAGQGISFIARYNWVFILLLWPLILIVNKILE